MKPNLFLVQATSNSLNVGMESVPEMLENLHILMQLSPQEHFAEKEGLIYNMTSKHFFS
jgi:hypothetical protein